MHERLALVLRYYDQDMAVVGEKVLPAADEGNGRWLIPTVYYGGPDTPAEAAFVGWTVVRPDVVENGLFAD